ncbi:MAG TPA: hypothetical protein VHK69_16520 [Chitinophagaceae bacterium]|jgi:hypothetical protein|nr:hypothetical protein [Chitinophagaceae bacterium]
MNRTGIYLLLLLTACHPESRQPVISGDPGKDIPGLLQTGTVSLRMYDSLGAKGRTRLFRDLKLQSGVNAEALVSFLQPYIERNEVPPYDEKLGISAAAYEQIRSAAPDDRLLYTHNEALAVYRKEDTLCFKGSGALGYVEHIRYIGKENKWIFWGDPLPCVDSSAVRAHTTLGPCRGYRYAYRQEGLFSYSFEKQLSVFVGLSAEGAVVLHFEAFGGTGGSVVYDIHDLLQLTGKDTAAALGLSQALTLNKN